jgi:hypothetical protein
MVTARLAHFILLAPAACGSASMVESSIYRKVKRYESFPPELDSAGVFAQPLLCRDQRHISARRGQFNAENSGKDHSVSAGF